jgi:hypothetical protein
MPDARSRTLKRERQTDRHASSTRVIRHPATHSHRRLASAIFIRINTVDDYQNRRKIRVLKRIRAGVTNRMCNEASGMRYGVYMCMMKKKGTGYFLFFETG